MKICHKCFQLEHTHKCYLISHPTISIKLDTHVPYSVILAILEDSGVKPINISYQPHLNQEPEKKT